MGWDLLFLCQLRAPYVEEGKAFPAHIETLAVIFPVY